MKGYLLRYTIVSAHVEATLLNPVKIFMKSGPIHEIDVTGQLVWIYLTTNRYRAYLGGKGLTFNSCCLLR